MVQAELQAQQPIAKKMNKKVMSFTFLILSLLSFGLMVYGFFCKDCIIAEKSVWYNLVFPFLAMQYVLYGVAFFFEKKSATKDILYRLFLWGIGMLMIIEILFIVYLDKLSEVF